MRLRKQSLTFATLIAALAAASAFDSASAFPTREPKSGSLEPSEQPIFTFDLSRAPQPSQRPPSATSRPSNRDMRPAPPGSGRGMRGGMGGGRMQGGMGRR
jgi:hypothetical protein